MAKIDVKVKNPTTSLPPIKPTDKKISFANNMSKQQKVNPAFNRTQKVTPRRTGKK